MRPHRDRATETALSLSRVTQLESRRAEEMLDATLADLEIKEIDLEIKEKATRSLEESVTVRTGSCY